jgi:hypothetical protein
MIMMIAAPEKCRPAGGLLIELAVQARPDWRPEDIKGAIVCCQLNGWSFGRTLMAVSRLLLDDEATPRDLLVQARDPLDISGNPYPAEEGAAFARELLARPREEA